MEMAYYPGCSLHASSKLYDVQCNLVLKKLGVTLKEVEDWSCCGATSAGKTDELLATAMPARNLGLAEATGLAEIVVPCSACYSRLLVAQERLKQSPTLQAEINAELAKKVKGEIKVSSIIEVLAAKIGPGLAPLKNLKPLKGLRPVAYYGCLMTRFPLDVKQPDDAENPQGLENILDALGAKSLDWNYKTACCGASAAVNDQETAFGLMADIMQDALARDANCLVTTCPMCQMNLDAYQDAFCQKYGIGERLPVYFITELVGVALGMAPEILQLDRHFVESQGLLRELDLL